jgi:CheY-like chemotaxis protein
MTAASSDFFPLRIFVVEDHEDTLKAMQLYLEQLGHIVFFAQTKAQALKEIPTVELSGSDLRYQSARWQRLGTHARNRELASRLRYSPERLWNES